MGSIHCAKTESVDGLLMSRRGNGSVASRPTGSTIMTDVTVPTAKPGDEFTYQAAPRPVAQVALADPHHEIQVLGIIPNAADGARVFIGAGLRRKDQLVVGNMAHQVNGALLDPAQAVETSALVAQLARRAAVMRGQIIAPEPTPALLELIIWLASSLPVHASMEISDQLMDSIRARLEEAKPERAN
jgi:hypothetical protein